MNTNRLKDNEFSTMTLSNFYHGRGLLVSFLALLKTVVVAKKEESVGQAAAES